jgi:ferredoxin/flavodoxin---NADP+ reductase
MPMEMNRNIQVAVIGAGPAGLFAAENLAAKGYGVALFNRDVKPGGLAEYGIFPDKYKLKNGLRNQFSIILASENIRYFGNTLIGRGNKIELSTLFDWGFKAVVIACGAQGIKSLHLPGEDLEGVMHAKDLVYHYNQLPPYSSQEFHFGKKVAIVGAGNVMADVCHFLTKYTNVEQITTIIRRGPGEVKFDKKEMESIIAYLDLEAFDKEIERVSSKMVKIGQDVQVIKNSILVALPKACPKEREVRLGFSFLYSPTEILSNNENHVRAIRLEENHLSLNDGVVVSSGTGTLKTLDVDNVVFAIGDRVLDELGLPLDRNEYCKSQSPLYPIEDNSFEIQDPTTRKNIPGVFIAGWSRNPSKGLVGTARKDGVNAAEAVSLFLAQKSNNNGVTGEDLERNIISLNHQVVLKKHLPILAAEEKLQANKLGLEEYKYSTNEEMLQVMGLM